ncbi:MAG TPA: UDP-N-acetylmuramate--L-alanine ligase [Acidobacteria bacterium]|nr:UDP-N-acetylmuramate--L-alanine ligase [Acidobacteriota bacterium]
MRLERLHLHFMGAGGAGMAALAELHLARGGRASGCDAHPSARIERLRRRGADVVTGHDPAHVEGADALVYSAAIPTTHPEIAAARSAGIPVVRRATLLAEMGRGRSVLAVAGTHGKTTTTALLGWVLTRLGLDPTVAAGGLVPAFDGHSRHGSGEAMVCEADEYDRSFLELNPAWLIVTNVEPEHLEVYGTVEELERAFVELARRVPFYGALVACADDPGAARVAAAAGVRTLSYGVSEGAWLRAAAVESGASGSRAVISAGGRRLGELRVTQPGLHNLANALAATAVALDLGLGFAAVAEAVAAFTGVARRFEIVGASDGVTVVDDYAHHPTELAALLAAARQRFPGHRLMVVFQPHLYSRTERFAGELGRVLARADLAIVAPVFAAREEPIPGVDAALVARAVQTAGGTARTAADLDDALALVRRLLEPGDVVLTAGAGDIDRVARRLVEVAP